MTTQTKALKEAHDLSLDGRDFAARQIILDVIANLEKEALAKPALMIYRGELCYKSQSDDQSFGMWCPVTQDLPFPEGTKFYTTPPQRKPLTDEEIAVVRALDNLIYWTERALNKGNANLDFEEAMQQYNDALAAAHGIKE